MGRQSELFRRAAECERLMDLAASRTRKGLFKQMRDIWIQLANECPNLSVGALAEGTLAIGELQSIVEEDRSCPTH